ncbi:hypothetical protein EVAR_8282_1 [Eumeta japonica]|uniref:Uncharacterized protein n=1 Tax=Eumeta variegata TaxID=151549 RepID=A0A4C1Y6Z3_EUMVA|nr:hypothetical protein EVAR_8282_1 [Eumeta japonica]
MTIEIMTKAATSRRITLKGNTFGTRDDNYASVKYVLSFTRKKRDECKASAQTATRILHATPRASPKRINVKRWTFACVPPQISI